MPIYPTQGWWPGLNLKKFGLGNVDSDYWQVNLDVRRYFELGGVYNSLTFYSLVTLTSWRVWRGYTSLHAVQPELDRWWRSRFSSVASGECNVPLRRGRG
jgi:hypothetical protein